MLDFIKFTKSKDENLTEPSVNRSDYNSYPEYIRAIADYVLNVDYELDIEEKFYNENVILNPDIFSKPTMLNETTGTCE